MKLRIYRVKFKELDVNLLKEVYHELSQDEFHLILKAFNQITGSEAYLTDSFMQVYGDDEWSLVDYNTENEGKWKRFMYELEQDETFGYYQNNWRDFSNDWDNHDYEPPGSITLDRRLFDIVEEVTG